MRAWLYSALVLLCLAAPAHAHQVPAPAAAVDGPLSAADLKIYAEAFHRADAGRFAQALEGAAGAGNPLPAKIIRWLELTDPAGRGDFEAVVAFLERNPDWPGQAALQRRAEAAMPEDWPEARVRAWFAARPPVTVEGAMRYAGLLLDAGERARAAALLREAWIERDFDRDQERAFRKRFAKLLTHADEVARLDRLLWDHRYRPAKRQARRLGGGYPALAEARLLLGRRGAGVDAAIRRVPAALRDDPGLVFERARWRWRHGRYRDVAELLDPPDPAAPRAEHWWPLRRWTVRRALAEGDISVAYRIADGHGMSAGLGFAEGEWLAGWIALRYLAQPQSAYQHFERLHAGVTTPISRARAAFWAGEAARALDALEPAGHWHAVARGWYAEAAGHPTTFYGQLGARRLGRRAEFDPPAPAPPGPAARAAFESRELVQAVRMLGQLGEARLQKRFLARLAVLAGSPEDYALVAGLAAGQARPDLALRVAKAALAEGIVLPDHLFPDRPVPEAEASEAALVLAVIRQESGFYPEAVSRAGARGLMQILPRTAQRVARQIKLRYSRKKLLTDPDYNMRLGRAYLSGLTERYSGSYVLALAAYNAGPSRADRWIRDFGDPRAGDVDPVDFIENIPLEETRNYVQRIIEGLVIYRQRLGAAGPDPLGPQALSAFRPVARDEVPADLSCCL